MTRIVFDISTLVRWTGPPVGIVRTERQLARWVKAQRPDTVFVFFEASEKRYRQISAAWLDATMAGDVTILRFDLPDATGRKRRRDRIPARIRPAVMAIPQLRRTLLLRLEEIRCRTSKPMTRRLAECIQQVLLTEKYRRMLFAPDGTRRRVLAYDSVIGNVIDLKTADTLICAGAGWAHQDIGALRATKMQTRFRLVTICYDLVPLRFPQFYRPHDVTEFRKHFDVAFPTADLVVVASRAVERDVIAYCAERTLQLNRLQVIPLGSDPGRIRPSRQSPLPPGLERGRFILLVSTIEPRKGHRLMYEIWLRLLAEGVPQASGFKLVFVGRPGWMVDDLMHSLTADTRLAGTLELISFASDDELVALYDAAAFCVYPSIYEGYGLPIVEAFARGKAAIVSNGGALAETVGNLSPCLDPHDQELWYTTVKRWILDPAARAPYEAAIRAQFRPRSWRETAAQFLQAVDATEHMAARGAWDNG